MGDLAAQLRAERQQVQTLALSLQKTHAAQQAADDHVGTLKRENRELRSSLTVTEPSVYTRDAPWSFFQDVLRVARNRGGNGDREPAEARKRLNKHAAEVAAGEPARRAADTRARHATENALSATPQEARALERFVNAGYPLWESRANSRTDGQGGYFTIPAWLVSDFVPAARAGQPIASLFRQLDLPQNVTTINIPQVIVGGARPFTTDLGPGGGRDITDAFVSARTITAFGQADVSLQWLELNPLPAADAIIMPDLAAALATMLDANCLLGNGGGGQLQGVLPAGATNAGVTTVNTNNANTSAQTFVNGGTAATFSPAGSVRQTLSQLMSLIGSRRAARPTHWVMAEQVWSWICGQTDSIGQPIIHDHGPHGDGSDAVPGAIAGWLLGLPVVVDPQLGPPPTGSGAGTFGGTTAPTAGLSATGQYETAAGTGNYPVILLGKWDDAYLWSNEPQLRVLTEVLSGTGLARVQLWSYHASAPARFQAPAAVSVSNTYSTGGVAKGGSVSYGTWVQYQANSPLAAGNLGGY